MHIVGPCSGRFQGEWDFPARKACLPQTNKECSQIFFLDQIVDESSVPSSTFKPLDQQKTDNKKYNGNGFIPDYDGYIS